jgi:hypothetical protein
VYVVLVVSTYSWVVDALSTLFYCLVLEFSIICIMLI